MHISKGYNALLNDDQSTVHETNTQYLFSFDYDSVHL